MAMTSEVVFKVTITTAQDMNNSAELGVLIESSLNKVLGQNVDDVKVEEVPDGEIANDPTASDKGGNAPRSKTPQEIADTKDIADAYAEDTAKFAEKRQVVVKEVQEVSSYMKNKKLQFDIIEEAESIQDSELPVFVQYFSKAEREAKKIEIATDRVLLKRANEEEYL